MEAEWSFVALGLFGELFARTNGPQQILKSCADLLAIMMKVRFLSPNPLWESLTFFTGSYLISTDSEQSTFPVALDYVRCIGQKNTLKDCIHFSHSYGCGHEDDLAVHCQPGYNLREYS